MKRAAIVFAMTAFFAGCIKTTVVVQQDKPMEFNINFKGQLNLVIQDARQDMEKITGEKPTNSVSLEDLGVNTTQGGAAAPSDTRTLAAEGPDDFIPVSLTHSGRAARAEGRLFKVALKDDLQGRMAARDKELRGLWDMQKVGESHTGLLVVKGTLTPAETALVNAENADRTAFFDDQAKAKNNKVEDVALGFYVARLGYAKKGAWYETKDAKGVWKWTHWDR